MKKRYLVAGVALGLAIIGGVGSAATMSTALPKLDRYIVERRAAILDNKEIFSSKDKVTQINMGNMNIAYNTTVNIKKSKDNTVRVTATCIKDKNYYNVSVKDGVLNIGLDENEKLEMDSGFDDGVYLGDDKKLHFMGQKYSLFAVPKEIITKELDKMAMSGVRINSDFSEFRRNYKSSLFEVNIEVPEGVNIVSNLSGTTGRISPVFVNVENGLIKDFVSTNSIFSLYSMNYDGKIKNYKVDMTSEKNNIVSLDNLQGLGNIEKMEVNLNPGTYFTGEFDGNKLADEVVFNVSGEKKEIGKNEDFYGLYNSEEEILDYLINKMTYPDSDDDDDDNTEGSISKRIGQLDRKSDKAKQEKALLEMFKAEIVKQKAREDDNDTYLAASRDFYSSYDMSLPVMTNMAKKVVVNAPDSNLRVELSKDENPDLDIKTKNGTDLKYYLVDKIDAEKIPSKDKIKVYKGTIYDLIKKLDAKNEKKGEVTNPALVINSKSLSILQEADDER